MKGFTAVRRYDLASGVGTVNAPAFVTELAMMVGHQHWTVPELRLALAKLP